MSTKFEQLLDYLVNEEMDKANELFHEIVVEKSKEIYENIIAEEEDEETDESRSHDEEDVEEAKDEEDVEEAKDEEDADESVEEAKDEEDVEEGFGEEDLEDSFEMGAEAADDDHDFDAADPTDKLGMDVAPDAGDEMGGDEESSEDEAMMDIKNAIEELEAAFAELEAAHGGEEAGEFGSDDMDDEKGSEFGSDDDEATDETMGSVYENKKRMTREYRETVGNDWEKNSQKEQGKYLGAGTGEKDGAPKEGKSPINTNAKSSMPNSKANAKNLAQGGDEGQKNTGTSPNKVNPGITPQKGEKLAAGMHNVDGVKSGVKTLKQQPGHGAEKKGGGEGKAAGAGTGQNSVTGGVNDKPLLKKL